MTWFVEDPTPIWIVGGLAQLVLFVILWRTGRMAVVPVMAGAALLAGLLLLAEHLIVTDREQVLDVLDTAAAAFEQNDQALLLAQISDRDDAAALRQQANTALGRANFKTVTFVTTPKITINRHTPSPTATAVFTVRADVESTGADQMRTTVVRKLKLTLRQDGDPWRLITAEDAPMSTRR
jgi:hypothetical protein